jgi:hypothetical protein
MESDCWVLALGFLNARERCCASLVSFSLWRRIMGARLLWRRLDLRGFAIREWQLLRLLQRVGHFVTALHLPTPLPLSPPAAPHDHFVTALHLSTSTPLPLSPPAAPPTPTPTPTPPPPPPLPPHRHPAVAWLMQCPEQLPSLRHFSVMSLLDDDAIMQLLANGVTNLCSWNTGVPKGMPPAVIFATGAGRGTGTAGAAGLEQRRITYNGQVFDPCEQQWVAADLCTAAGRLGERCTEAPKFSWHTRSCDWCHRSSCRHCRVVQFRGYATTSATGDIDISASGRGCTWSCGCSAAPPLL